MFVESIHSVRIDMMGNYHANDGNNLRPIDTSQVRVNSFGNPFKTKHMEYVGLIFKDFTNIKDVKIDETTDSSEGNSPTKNKNPSQFKKQREYKNRRKRFFAQRVGRIRRSLSQSYIDSLGELGEFTTENKKTQNNDELGEISMVEEGRVEEDIASETSESYDYWTDTGDEEEMPFSTINSTLSGRSLNSVVQKYAQLVRMHVMSTFCEAF